MPRAEILLPALYVNSRSPLVWQCYNVRYQAPFSYFNKIF